MPMHWPLNRTLTPRGPYDIDADYDLGDVVSYLGATWYCGRPSHGNPPPSTDWWGPFVPGAEPGAAGGHVIRDGDSNDLPLRRYLHFDNQDSSNQWGTVTDDAGADETVITYPVNDHLPEGEVDRIRAMLGGVSFPPTDLTLAPNFAIPTPPVPPPKWSVDKYGITRLQGAIRSLSGSEGALTEFATLPPDAQPRGTVRLPVTRTDPSSPFDPMTYIMIDNDGVCYTDIEAADQLIYLDCKFPSGDGFGGFPALPESDVVPHGPADTAMRTVRVGADGIGLEGIARITGKSSEIVLCDLPNKFYPTADPYSLMDMQAPPHRWDGHGSFTVVGGKYEGISGTSQIWDGVAADYNIMYLAVEDMPPISFGHASSFRITMGIIGVPSHPSNVIDVDLHFAFRCRSGPTDFTD